MKNRRICTVFVWVRAGLRPIALSVVVKLNDGYLKLFFNLGEQMNDRMNEPLCRFGPGGDYVKDLSPSALNTAKKRGTVENSLTRVLYTLADIVNSVLDMNEADVNSENKGKGPVYVANNTDSEAASIAEGRGNISEQQLLFPDDWRAGRATRNKPQYRLRTYRRTSKKRHVVGHERQGTLFGPDFRSARIA